MKQLTLIVPYYNDETRLVKALDCLNEQTISIFSVMIFDNKSDEALNLSALCRGRNYQISMSRSNKKLCKGGSWAAALDLSKTEYTMLFHTGCRLKSDYIERLYELIEKYPHASVYSSQNKLVDCDEDVNYQSTKFRSNVTYLTPPGAILNKLFPNMSIGGLTFKTEVLKNCRIRSDYTESQDWDFFLQLERNYWVCRSGLLKSHVIASHPSSLRRLAAWSENQAIYQNNFGPRFGRILSNCSSIGQFINGTSFLKRLTWTIILIIDKVLKVRYLFVTQQR